MPAEKECTKLIPQIYKRNAENIMLFCWVNAQRQILPTITIEQAIWGFLKFSKIEWDMECAKSTYTRLQKEFYEDFKT
jgi:hypothetical protein